MGLLKLIAVFVAALITTESRANEAGAQFLYAGITRNYPVSFTELQLAPGPLSPIFGYRYHISSEWSTGLSVQFKVLGPRNPGDHFSLFTISEEIFYNLRLYHPLYLQIGAKAQYYMPTKEARFPLRRPQTYDNELGAAASFGLLYFWGERWLLQLSFDRWRGTKTFKLHGAEIALLAGYQL